MTSAIPTFCLVCQDGALCWRNCEGPGQGGASDFILYVASVPPADRNVNTAAMHLKYVIFKSYSIHVCACCHGFYVILSRACCHN